LAGVASRLHRPFLDVMKRIYLLLFAYIIAIHPVIAQEKYQKISPFLFEEFLEAEVFFKDGSRYIETMNYNLLSGKFCFIDSKTREIQDVSNPQDIALVKLAGRVFYQEKKGVVEVVPITPPLFVQYKALIRKESNRGAYGTTSETSSIHTYGGFTVNGSRYELRKEELVIGKRYQHYWLEKNGKRKAFKNFKQFLKLYPEHKVALEQFIKENQLDIDNVEHVKVLCVHAESL